ncbi:MAG: alpha/beta hydrolase [Clostridium sp.]|nr:alpha/beta hydrolase [Clostridiales bacterium]MCC8087265.1 alpha/beta hydrolase [Clostridium sp.]MCC8177029.1 alpha/beta hydrolase [Bacteroidales bacterium]
MRLKMIIGLTILAVFIVFILVVLLYHNNAYPESQEIADEMEMEGRDYWFYGDTGVGFIIFTGAKVDEPGYAYIAGQLHEEGHTVVIPNQIFTMSAFGTNHAIEIMKEHTEINKWILVGHSLGGMPVSRVAEQAPEYLTGIVYLASYAFSDLSGLDFPALRITADHDGVMNNERMENYAHNLPTGSETVELEDANHRGFGGYFSRFSREEDVALTWQEQNTICVNLILDFYAEQIKDAENK